MEEIEVWKDIEDYEGLYQISNIGRVKSIRREIVRTNNSNYFLDGKILSPSYGGNKYPSVNLWRNKTYKTFTIHRLIAIHFIPNPDNLKHINHKNGKKYDFNIDNLEWCTHKENMIHASRNGLIKFHMIGKSGSKHHNSKPIIKLDNAGEFVQEFSSIMEAERTTGIGHSQLSRSCKKNKPFKGFIWKYK